MTSLHPKLKHPSNQYSSIHPPWQFANCSREGSQNAASRHPPDALYGDPSKHYSRSLLGVNSECRQLALTPYCPHSDLPLNKTLPGSIACTTATQPQQTTWVQDNPTPSHNLLGIVPPPLIDPKKYLTPDHFYEATGWPSPARGRDRVAVHPGRDANYNFVIKLSSFFSCSNMYFHVCSCAWKDGWMDERMNEFMGECLIFKEADWWHSILAISGSSDNIRIKNIVYS